MPAIDADLQAAYLYSFPYYEMARTRYLMLDFPLNPQRGEVNTLLHRRSLADHRTRGVTTPNNDTLYSVAWLDLDAGPLALTLPRVAGRYWSLQFMDASSGTAALLGSRLDGQGGFELWVMRDGDPRQPPAGVRVLRLPTRDVWMLARFGLDGAADLQAVHALQDAMRLQPVVSGAAPAAPRAPQRALGSPEDGSNYLAVVNDMLARNGVPAAEKAMVAGWSTLGIGMTAPSAEQASRWDAGLPALNAALRETGGISAAATTARGWSYPDAAIGTYGGNHALRARVALGGLAALPPQEALYLSATSDNNGEPLHGQHRYRLRLPAEGIDAAAFWSLTMYQVEPDGRLFFVDNPIARYAVGDRTRGLSKGANGAIELVVQPQPPAEPAKQANWLPSPQGPFRLILRAYGPSVALAQGQAPLPVIEKLP